MHSYRGTHSTTTLPTLLLIPSTPSTASNTAATPTSIKNIKVYLVIAISIRVNIVYKQVTEIVKNI